MEMKLPCPASHVIQLYFKNFNDHAQHDITDVSRDLPSVNLVQLQIK